MNLLPDDLNKYLELQKTVRKNDAIKVGLKVQRKAIVEKNRARSTLPERPIKSKLGAEAQQEKVFKKILLEMNPMEQKKIRPNFPSKRKSPMTFTQEYIEKLHARETNGWNFMSDYDESTSRFEN